MNKKVSYDNLKNFVTKEAINRAKHAIGNAASLKLTNRLFSCVLAITFFGIAIYALGTGTSKMGTTPDDIHVISVSTAFAMGAFDKIVPPLTKLSLVLFFWFAILNVIPKKNLAYQLFLELYLPFGSLLVFVSLL
ncbi:hypothetical protein [Ligilactobacillus acidipiscis]|uniref:hypothetical protein n=1 Tax=Ligilactobacillus acidipiscis TaxID=89059 RepID=UPI0023F6FC07|nr:hypothetical protein [Ligilactobacillus acidipiscis]WEV56406.1 hypothetical protein OZX66_09260 [Ligilactobacillus acidipiscis]